MIARAASVSPSTSVSTEAGVSISISWFRRKSTRCMKARTALSGVSWVGMRWRPNRRRASAAAPSPSQLVSTGLRPYFGTASSVVITAWAASAPSATAVGQFSTRMASAPGSPIRVASASA